MIERRLREGWAKATERYMQENPRAFPSPTSAGAVETYIETKIDPQLKCVEIFASSIDGETTSRQILTLLLNQVVRKEENGQKDSTQQCQREKIRHYKRHGDYWQHWSKASVHDVI